MDTAPDFDNTQAKSEGWIINERSDNPPFAIETLDDVSEHPDNTTGFAFGCDQEAYDHVLKRSNEGSCYHQLALDYLKKWSPEAYRWVIGGTPDDVVGDSL